MEPNKNKKLTKKKYRAVTAWDDEYRHDVICIIEEDTVRLLLSIRDEWGNGPSTNYRSLGSEENVLEGRIYEYSVNRIDVVVPGIYFVDADRITAAFDLPWEEYRHSDTIELDEELVKSCIPELTNPTEISVCLFGGTGQGFFAEQYEGSWGTGSKLYSPLKAIPELSLCFKCEIGIDRII